MRPTLVGLLAGALALSASATVLAGHVGPTDRYQTVTRYDFDGDHIDARRLGPDGKILTEIPRAQHPSLIDLRLNFTDELVKSAKGI